MIIVEVKRKLQKIRNQLEKRRRGEGAISRPILKSLKQRLDFWLLLIVVFAVFFNMYGIWNKGYVNVYYTSAVTSMLQSWHNFFFASFDPAGFVTVDKPPVALWLQAFSVHIFGLQGWSLILPQALAGIGSVVLIYKLVGPTFGKPSARLAALIGACTPIATAVNRTNNMDGILVFTLLLAAQILLTGVKTKRPIMVGAAFALVGVGFNIKMLQAYVVLPAFGLFLLLAYDAGWKKKLGVLAVSVAALIMVSLSWGFAVDGVSPANRPYIGGSQTNSVLEMAFGYNGVSRLTGTTSGGAQLGGLFNAGAPGLLRLFQLPLAPQISWLLPLAMWLALGLLAERGKQRGEGHQGIGSWSAGRKESIFWLAWLLPGMVLFSGAGFVHAYYLIMLAPPIAVLAGAGWITMFDSYRCGKGWRQWLLPAGLCGTALFEASLLIPYQSQIGKGWPWIVGGGGAILALILCLRFKAINIARAGAVGGIMILLAAPVYWAATPMLYGGADMMPEAGPQLKPLGRAAGIEQQLEMNVDQQLIDYLTAHSTGETYLFGLTDSSLIAAPYMIKTGRAVMAIGGFAGSDPVLSVDSLVQLVRDGKVKYFLVASGGSRGGNLALLQWIQGHGREVPKREWQSADPNRRGGMLDFAVLYEINL